MRITQNKESKKEKKKKQENFVLKKNGRKRMFFTTFHLIWNERECSKKIDELKKKQIYF